MIRLRRLVAVVGIAAMSAWAGVAILAAAAIVGRS